MTHHNDLTAMSAVALRAAIGRREISPVELMDACIDRIAAFNPAINAIAATDFERARTAARAAEQAVMRGDTLGLLHGLPLGVKDLLDTAGLLSTSGNVGRRNHVPLHDNALVARLRAAEVDGQAMRNYYHWLALTYVPTLATNPALALPCGVDEAGMPFGLQVIGRLRGDARLLAMAAALERAFASDAALLRPRPDLQALQDAHPELRSIVTHPPGTGTDTACATTSAV